MIIGISGPSGSGKTTIARALRQVYASQPNLCKSVQILHQDDFYKAEKDIPTITTRAGKVTNWDCPEAIGMHAFIKTLQTWRHNGFFPAHVQQDLEKRAKEDQNDTGDTGINASTISQLLKNGRLPRINDDLLIVDGFMLFQESEIIRLCDLAILLRGSHDKLKSRREARSGYVTLEGFWKDPEGYFDDCVWPEYVAAHKQFFHNKDVHGKPLDQMDLVIADQVDMNLEDSLEFVLDALQNCKF